MISDISDAEAIERDLARTRARMDSRLDELQDHLTPKQMLNDAFAYFRGGDGSGFTNELIGKAKANPLPIALTAIGIAWLMASSQQRDVPAAKSNAPTKSPYGDDLDARLRRAEGDVDRSSYDDDAGYAAGLDTARGHVLGIVRSASDTAASYTQRIKEALTAANHSVRQASHDLTSSSSKALGQLGDSISTQTANIYEGTQTMAQSSRTAFASLTSNPFALGTVAALVGVVAGSLIPTLDEEEHALGAVAQKLKTTGRDLAQDVVDRGGRIANDTLEAVKGSAESHGLVADRPVGEVLAEVKSGDLFSNVKHVAQETLQAGKDSAQTHFAGNADVEASENRG